MAKSPERIINVFLESGFDESKRTAEIEYEYQTAVRDLLAKSYFHLCKNPGNAPVDRGPYNLHLRIEDGRLIMDLRLMKKQDDDSYKEMMSEVVKVPMSPFRRIIKDYFFICESHMNAVKSSNPSQIETIDMARRGIHNDGAEILKNILSPNVETDFDTARRLFTLVCLLHIR